MPANFDLGDYEIDDDSNGDLVIKDPSDNIVFRWDETNARWDFEQNPIQGVSDFTADSVSTDTRSTKKRPVADVAHPDYGADPTGETDSAAAFNDALSSNGMTLVPEGEYLIQSDITVTDALVSFGKRNPNLILDNGASVILDGKFPHFRGIDVRRATGDEKNDHGIVVKLGTHRWTIRDTVVFEQDTGIRVEADCWVGRIDNANLIGCVNGLKAYASFNSVLLSGVHARSNDENGYHITSTGHGATFQGCRAEGNGSAGIRIDSRYSQASLVGCYVEANNSAGGLKIKFDSNEGPDVISVIGSTFVESLNGNAQIDCGSAQNVVAVGNRFHQTDGEVFLTTTAQVENKYQLLSMGNYYDGTETDVYSTPGLARDMTLSALGGPDTERPTFVGEGHEYYDTTLGQQIVYNGSNWVNPDGSPL